jgi:hypothetical protein
MQRRSAIVTQGHRVASGLSSQSPYPKGTIAMQTPYFLDLGLDLTSYYPGTLNLFFEQQKCQILKADYTFERVQWASGFAPESFSFVRCELLCDAGKHAVWIYHPHPETKTQHFQNQSTLEIIAPFIETLHYGDQVTLAYDPKQLSITANRQYRN